jgi:hypothetical protein
MIGAGSQAKIWRAVALDGRPKPQICVKVFDVSATGSPEEAAIRAAAMREATILAKLQSHSNIVSLINADPDGAWIALDLVRGASLKVLLQSLSRSGRKMAPSHAAWIASGVCKALVHMHGPTLDDSSVIVHRDVSPGNILISYRGEVKLADFGIAKVLSTEPRTKTVLGTLEYMAPEQARLEAVDGRNDQFSLGVVLYEALTGKRPVSGRGFEAQAKLAAGDYPRLTDVVREDCLDVPQGFVAFVERLMAPDADHRFENTLAALVKLSEVVQQELFLPLHLGLELGESIAMARPPAFFGLDTAAVDVLLHDSRRAMNFPTSDAPRAEKTTVPMVTVMPAELLRPVREHVGGAPSYEQPEKPVALEPRAPIDIGEATAVPLPRQRTGRARLFAAMGAVVLGVGVAGGAWTFLSEPRRLVVADSPPARAAVMVSSVVHAPETPNSDHRPPAQENIPPQEARGASTIGTGAVVTEPPAHDAKTVSPSPTTRKKKPGESATATAELTIGAVAPVEIWIDGKRRGKAESMSPVRATVSAGHHVVVAVGADRRSVTREITVSKGEKLDILFDD